MEKKLTSGSVLKNILVFHFLTFYPICFKLFTVWQIFISLDNSG